ncbi:hypothetical protein, partial [Methylophaga sp. UBA3191]|uniref:hypothetical protein n=1 Tax=Methylophaga sp. UBA3191 TaxID=1946881 RepID=UPI0025E7F5A3
VVAMWMYRLAESANRVFSVLRNVDLVVGFGSMITPIRGVLSRAGGVPVLQGQNRADHTLTHVNTL